MTKYGLIPKTPYCCVCGRTFPHGDAPLSPDEERLHAAFKRSGIPTFNPHTGRPLSKSPFSPDQIDWTRVMVVDREK